MAGGEARPGGTTRRPGANGRAVARGPDRRARGPRLGRLGADVVVLGIDPGTRILGYGAIVVGRARSRFVTAGVVKPPAGLALAARLARISAELDGLLTELRPDVVAIERAFGGRNVQSALRLGEARGIAIAAAARVAAEVVELTPAEAKRAVVGSGAADKEQVAAMVMRHLDLEDPGGPRDATDALAVALAHVLTDRATLVE